MRLEEDPDEFLKETLLTGLEERLTARSSEREPATLDRLRISRALEMVMKKKRDALVKDSSDINALLGYFSCLTNFLDLELPDKRDLYWEPMKFLTSVLDQARRGSLHPILQRKVHSRPTDCLAKKKFKVGCAVASDLYYEADKQAGLQCRSITRAQADHFVCRQSRVQKAAKKFGLHPLRQL